MPGIVVTGGGSPSVITLDWGLPTSVDISYSKGGGSQAQKSLILVIKGQYAVTSAEQAKYKFSIAPLSPLEFSLGNVYQVDTDYDLEENGTSALVKMPVVIDNMHLLLPGVYSSNLKIEVLKKVDNTLIEEKNIPINITVVDGGEIETNLNTDLNFCLDKHLTVDINDPTATYARFDYTINFDGKTWNLEYFFALVDGKVSVPVGKPIQPYIYLPENQINQFFEIFKLDMQPAVVGLEISLLDLDYSVLKLFNFGNYNFHPGYSKNIPEDGATIERSLSYNSFLPLAYMYSSNNIEFKYKGKSKEFNKPQFSSPNHIFQTLFNQKFHFNEIIGGSFSPAFSPAFATIESLLKANPFYLYEEGYINEINSDYNVKGINFPWQLNSWNIIWLDENNIFRGMAFTGEFEKEKEFTQYINEANEDFRYRKAGALGVKSLKINSGWKLKSEIPLFDSLIFSKRAWIFQGDPLKRVEITCKTKKLIPEKSSQELIEFVIDFDIDED